MSELQGIIAGVLEGQETTRDIVQEPDIFATLCSLVNPAKKSLIQFQAYLREECGISMKVIYTILDKLSLDIGFKAALGKSIIISLLKYRTFEALDIIKKAEEEKRQKITTVIENYKFPAPNMEDFVRTCIKAVQGDESQLKDIKQLILCERKEEIEKLFTPEEPIVQHQILEYNPDKSIMEQLKDFIQDYKQFPEGSLERVLQREHIIAFLSKYPQAKAFQILRDIPELKDEPNDIATLKKVYLKENGVLNSDISKLFKKMESQEGSKEIYQNISALKAKVLPINVLQLERLIKKTSQAKNKIKDKDVIFILGTTGSGKSTNILKFLGYTLKPAKFKQLPTLIPKEKLSDVHKTFYTSPQAKSCTRYINATVIPSEMYPLGTQEKLKNIVICDSPGFGDSAGVQVDIANGVGMINALHGSRSVRVVVLLAHDALTGDRMEGAVKVGNIISNLFTQINKVGKCIAIYFNKVPKSQRENVKALINSKMEHLSQADKANGKLMAFFQILLKKSQQKMNYIDPLESDYKQLFEELFNMKKIGQVKETFKYQFTGLTKQEINGFVMSQRGKVKDYIAKQRYEQARFHLKMLEKLKDILFTNQKMQEVYSEVAKFIQNQSLKELKTFEQHLIQICNGEQSTKFSQNLTASKKKVQKYQKNFHDFQDIVPASKQEINKMVQQYKEKLINEFKDLGSSNPKKLLSAVRIFSRELAPQLEESVLETISKQFKQAYKAISSLIDEKIYQGMAEHIKILKTTSKCISSLSSQHYSQKQLEQLGKRFGDEIDQCFLYTSDNIINDAFPLTQRNVNSAKEKLFIIQQILILKIIDDPSNITKRLNQCIKEIINKCKTRIRSLDSIDFSITSQEKLPNTDKSYLKDLASKKKDIEILMTISNVGEVLKQDYEYTKQNIGRRLNENVEILNNCISALRSNKSNEIERDVSLIKKAADIVLKCSQIVDQGENSKQIAESISGQFLNYLSGELQTLKGIQIRLSQINSQSLRKIDRQYQKIETYSKMESIDDRIKNAVKQLKQHFNTTLKNPFAEFKARQISYLQQKGHYKYLVFSLERLEKLCFYSYEIQQIVNPRDYDGISFDQNSENGINNILFKMIQEMKQEAAKFTENQRSNLFQQPQYLRELIKILIALSPNKYTCLYLSKKMDFEVSSQIQNIKHQIVDIKESINARFREQQANNKLEELMSLVKICRFYSNIEEALKIKEETEKLHFSKLEKQINTFYLQHIREDESRAKSLTENIWPSKIFWSEVKAIYNQFYQIKTPSGAQKRAIITRALNETQAFIKSQLTKLQSQINNPNHIEIKQKMNEFLNIFNEAICIKRQITSFYKEEDKEHIIISDSLLKGAESKIIQAFEIDYKSIKDQLDENNVANIKQKLDNFEYFQSIIQRVFLSEDNNYELDNVENAKIIEKFMDKNRKILKEQIISHQSIEKSDRLMVQQSKDIKLKTLFDILQRIISQQIQSKYEHFTNSFIIDSGFRKYYNNFVHPRNETNQESLRKLITNANQYFDSLFNELKQKSAKSVEASRDIESKIIQAIENLPPELKQRFNDSLRKVKSEIKAQNDDMFRDLSQKIAVNPNEIDNYLQKALNANRDGQQSIHNMFVERLEMVYVEKSIKAQSVPNKIAFINHYFIKVNNRNRLFLTNDTKMQRKISQKFDQQLKRLLSIANTHLDSIKKFIDDPIKAQRQGIDARQLIADIMKAHQLIIKLQNDQIELKKRFIKLMEDRLEEAVEIYTQKLASQPQENVSSSQILSNEKTKRLQSFIEYLNSAGEVVERIKIQLEKIGLIESKEDIAQETIKKYKNIERYDENIRFYEKQVDNMLQSANGFEFYDEKKRNMTMKQIQAELKTLQRNLEILKQRSEFFHKFILSQNRCYDPNAISDNLSRKLKKLLCESKSEIEQTFKDYNNDPASKVNLLMNIYKILREKKLKIVPNEEAQEGYEEMSKLIKRRFEIIRQETNQKMKIAKQKTMEIQIEIRENQDIKKLQIADIQQYIQTKLQEKIEEITQSFDQRIAAQTDPNRAKDYQKSKKTQINSFKNQSNFEKEQKIQQIEGKYGVVLNELKERLEIPIRQLADKLTLYKKAILDINFDNQRQLSHFEIMLDDIPKAGPKFIKLIQHQLDNNPNDRQSIGRVLLTTSKVFANFVTRMINKLIRGKDIDYVLEHLKKIGFNGRQPIFQSQKNTVKKKYEIFNNKYVQYKDLYRKNPNESIVSFIATSCRDLGSRLKTDFYQNSSPCNDDNDKMELLAGVFALWVIQKAEKFEDEVQYTIEPHPTQITTLILLLGIDNNEESISNKLAQVGTGEGKSIVLAGLSCYLALCGFKVRCACYSAYLSCRDQSNFRNLFERLGVENNIKYGTFNQICQDILNRDGNFKAQVQKMILEEPRVQFQQLASRFGQNLGKFKKDNRVSNIINQNPTVLLIDQVDVFFNDNFFGSTYCPSIRLRDISVSKFLQYVWQEVKKRGQNIDPAALIKSKQFDNLLQVYPCLAQLLQNQIHGMISGALSYKHDYFLIDKKLVYKDNDTISQNISYGYKTVFANIYEHYKGNVSRSNLDEALQISLMVAEFSYAVLPKYFDCILGVTGTLQVLQQYKKRQLKQRYGINDQYAIPSAFGINRRRVDNYYIVQQTTYHQTIIQKINQIQNRRPIIIFFKTARELNEFSQSPQYEQFIRRTSNLTEEHEPSVRDSRIVRATNADIITLMTNSFGRGTDFILLDQRIKENGGLHVIQAFLSLEDSQEVQIKGRTARQSNDGSYDCIISENWLQELNLKTSSIPSDANSDAIHNILHRAREDKIENLSQTTLKLLEDSDKKHQNIVEIFIKKQLTHMDLIKYVSNLNEYPEITRVNIKTVLGLDATGSMGAALKKTCEIIGTAFERTYEVLNEKKVKASIDIKIMVYRNYNSPFDEILETTAYENTPQNLRKFLQRVVPKGGWGNEALEVFFQSLNKEERIDQVILIGDAQSNTPNEVIGKRAGKGENYWNSHGFSSTNIEKELQTFAMRRSPVHCFYLNARAAFNTISTRTGGVSSPFDLKSGRAADELTAFVVENVLKLIENKVGNNRLNLVQTYRKMFS